MTKYIALLRGVNVGGKNKVPMPLLQAAFEAAGFSQVSTYINSGNLIFCGAEQDVLTLQEQCRQIIRTTFALEIVLAVIPAEDYIAALKQAPVWWSADPDSTHNALFVIAPATTASVIQTVGEAKPDYEQIAAVGPVIFWSAPRKTYSRTRWSKITATPAYGDITIRNANTSKKLLQLLQE